MAGYDADGETIDRQGPVGDIFSLHAVHSPDDGGWYCEVWYHSNDQKRTVVGHEICDGIWSTSAEALTEGRSVGAGRSLATKPFHTSIGES